MRLAMKRIPNSIDSFLMAQSMVRILNVVALLTFLACYLEWGKDKSEFFFQLEYYVFLQNPTIDSFTHPLIFAPLIGQILLLYATFQKAPSWKIIIVGLTPLTLVALLVFTVGILSSNIKIAVSPIPFLLVLIVYIRTFRKKM
jgi:hypothetical protein